MLSTEAIAENAARVQREIQAAAARAGRDAAAIRLVAVTKTFPAEIIRAGYQAGLRDFGENRVQEFIGKAPQVQLSGARFHLIGHLQSNKVAQATAFDWIQTVDSQPLAHRLNQAAAQAGKRLQALIQVKLSDETDEEARKTGAPEFAAAPLAACIAPLEHLELRGLMLIPPYTSDPEGARPFFRRLRLLRDRLQAEGFPQIAELSMGMSHDFPIAIEEGATMVRIGTALFGPRAPNPPAQLRGPR